MMFHSPRFCSGKTPTRSAQRAKLPARHLHEHHPDIIERLRLRLRRIRRGSILLLGPRMDMAFRCGTEGPGRWDFRIPFLTPADDDASSAGHCCPDGLSFTHGLRARP